MFVKQWLRRGITLRRALAGFMLIIGLGRLGLWTALSQANALPVATYGWLLTGLALALLLTEHLRARKRGRIAAGLSAILLAGMAWDVGTLGVTALLEVWLALCLTYEMAVPDD